MRQLARLLPFLLLAACPKPPVTPTDHTTPAQNNVPTAATPPQSTSQNTDKTCNGDTDCGDRQLCIRARCVDIDSSVAECNELKVYFPFDSSQIAPDDRSYLERSSRCLKADHALHVRIEGNADERGTEEYNLALGDKRARAVADYLKALGASDLQMKTVSYGKEQPLCNEHDEACWSKNRRAQLKMSSARRMN
jgi:peptidoglycan-associated lipoprotein